MHLSLLPKRAARAGGPGGKGGPGGARAGRAGPGGARGGQGGARGGPGRNRTLSTEIGRCFPGPILKVSGSLESAGSGSLGQGGGYAVPKEMSTKRLWW